MATSTHTPGPWLVDRQEPGELWIAGAGRTHPVCMVTGAGFVTERDEADARLIAAAPDMLAALALALPIIGDRAAGGRMLTPHQYAADAFQKINAAIARATGGDS